jgi:putative spermidine/putrescine transport system permease protein
VAKRKQVLRSPPKGGFFFNFRLPLSGPFWLVLPATGFLALFFVYPLVNILLRSVTEPEPGLGNFVRFFESPVFARVLVKTLQMSLVVTALCLLLGYPYAYLMTLVGGRWAGLLFIAVLVPFWSSILVRTYAWTVILQDTGVINRFLMSLGVIQEPLPLVRNFLGVVIGMVHILLPFMVLPIYAVMQRIDMDYVRAAASLGASPLTAFRRVFLPLSLPGVYAGCLLVFVVALGFYITPALLGSPRQAMLSELVVQQISQLRNWGMGSTLAVVLLVVTLAVLAAVGRLVNINRALEGES